MWNSFNKFAEKAQAVAEKAKTMAADLEGQLDKSVGIEGQPDAAIATATDTTDFGADDEDENAWNDDDFEMDDDDGDNEVVNHNNKEAEAKEECLDTTTTTTTPKDTMFPISAVDNNDDAVAEEREKNLLATSTGTAAKDSSFLPPVDNDGLEAPATMDESQPTENRSVIVNNEGQMWPSRQEEQEPQKGGGDGDDPVLHDDDGMGDSATAQEDETDLSEGPSKSVASEPDSDVVVVEAATDTVVEAATDTAAPVSSAEAPSLEPSPVESQPMQDMPELKPPIENDEPVLHHDESSQTNEADDNHDMSAPVAPAPTLPSPAVEAVAAAVPPTNGSSEAAAAVHDEMNKENQRLRDQLAMLQDQLQQREHQLASKAEQITKQHSMHESEKVELEKRLEHTKEEAKKRIASAKARVEAAEKRAAAASSSSSESAAQQEELISALRAEGEKLARKQAEMEKAVRTAKGEARELRDQVEIEETAKQHALEKISKLEAELKGTKADLTAARKGESQASKLDADLQSAREESERKAATILALEQQVKELKAASKDLVKELEAARKGAALDSEREQKKLKKEHTSMLEDLETKLRTTEKEAAVREDALRHEVAELRKRWQDAVRRADSLSMDVQSSTAPLMRQLESMERQNRTRAAGWAALETKLRQDLEDAVIETEKLQKERNEIKTKHQRLERQYNEMETEFKSVQIGHEEKTKSIQDLETKLSEMETTHAQQKEEWDEVQRLANEGVAKVRSEMTQTVVEAEERHVSQLDALKNELQQEHDKRKQLEDQVQGLLDKTANMAIPANDVESAVATLPPKAPPKRLSGGQGQAEILAGALGGLGGEDSEGENDDLEDDENDDDNDVLKAMKGGGSFAALEELQSRLKVAKVELNTLRKSLADSEKTREKLVSELADARHAKEKLPLFEKKVEELTAENEQMTLEIQGLQSDIQEVRELYRAQLNVLLEEKALAAGDKAPTTETEEKPAVEDSETEEKPAVEDSETEEKPAVEDSEEETAAKQDLLI